jgi:hypothetical protein
MMSTAVTAQQLCEHIQDLSEESLSELAKYIEFLRFKTRTAAIVEGTEESLRIIRLRGLLKGYDFSPELIAEARREMWRKFGAEEP